MEDGAEGESSVFIDHSSLIIHAFFYVFPPYQKLLRHAWGRRERSTSSVMGGWSLTPQLS
jgi:hypothetical protein